MNQALRRKMEADKKAGADGENRLTLLTSFANR